VDEQKEALYVASTFDLLPRIRYFRTHLGVAASVSQRMRWIAPMFRADLRLTPQANPLKRAFHSKLAEGRTPRQRGIAH
jgi:hypothetical protein